MPIYLDAIARLAGEPKNAGKLAAADAVGRAVSFECGSTIAYDVTVAGSLIDELRFTTNGCGFMTAAAEVLSTSLKDRELGDLHGLEDKELRSVVEASCTEYPAERLQCLDVAIDALRSTFADLRKNRIAEFIGEGGLICTCFGVSEETIEECIEKDKADTVDEVSQYCRAGSGCGSCRMLIEEMLDARDREADLI